MMLGFSAASANACAQRNRQVVSVVMFCFIVSF